MQLGLLIALIVMVIDVFVPRGICTGVLQILAVMATLSSPRREDAIKVAAVSTFFVLSAEVLAKDPDDTELWKIAFNRVLTFVVIWGTAFVIYLRGRALDQLEIVSRQLNKELDYASRLQKKLYPKDSPSIEGIDVSGTVVPAERLCGDYYDYLSMADGTHGFVIGDVSGHGVGQSLIMSEVRSSLRSLVRSEDDLGKILSSINRRLLDDAPDEIFVTLMIVRLDPRTMTFTYATAGHCGLLLRASGDCEELRCGSLALGLSRDARYTTSKPVQFDVGDTLLLTTDGLEERHSRSDELFGRKRIILEAQRARDCSSEEVIRRLLDAATDFAQGLRPHDDVTLVVLKRTGGGKAAAGADARPRKTQLETDRIPAG